MIDGLTGILLGLVYMGPFFIAHHKKRKNELAICVFNFIAGWTIVGWFVALIWSLTEG